jgi:hypothetical protein
LKKVPFQKLPGSAEDTTFHAFATRPCSEDMVTSRACAGVRLALPVGR